MPPTADSLRGTIEQLKRSLFLRETERVCDLYRQILVADPTFMLRGPVQFDLARLIDKGGDRDLAFKAYSIICDHQRDNKALAPSLLAAGRLAFFLNRDHDAVRFLKDFLLTTPLMIEREEALDYIEKLNAKSLPLPKDESFNDSIRLTDELHKTPVLVKRRKKDSVYVEWEMSSEENPMLGDTPSSKAELKPRKVIDLEAVDVHSRRPSSDGVAKPRRDHADGFGSTPRQIVSSIDLKQSSFEPAARKSKPAAKPELQLTDSSPGRSNSAPQKAAKSPAAPHPPKVATKSVAPVTPFEIAVPPSPHESPEARHDRLSQGRFALLLPHRKRINLDNVATFVSDIEGLSQKDAKLAVLERKGLIFENLTMPQVLDLVPRVRPFEGSLVFMHMPDHMMAHGSMEVVSAICHDKGLKLRTGNAERKLRWSAIKLINCGIVGGEGRVTLCGGDPNWEYRFIEDVFAIEECIPSERDSFHAGLKEFLEILSQRAPQAVVSHTAKIILTGRARQAQIFGNESEYRHYGNWLLYSHCGEAIDAEELLEVSQVASNW